MKDRLSLIVAGIIGIFYLSIEVIFRALVHEMSDHPYFALFGYSSLHMAWVGALTVFFMGKVAAGEPNQSFAWFLKVIKSIVVAEGIELTTGLILNKWLGFGIWNYSMFKFNLFGQICPEFALAWLFLAPFALWLDASIVSAKNDVKNLASFYYRTFFWWLK